MTVGAHGEASSDHLAAIYVHAGAGFHSASNEHIHLEACAAAARAGMLVLKSDGSALDAVEIALRCLEDNEVTNAGYGSNLTMDGTVECDATIVDHLGRSGAVGAIAGIKNPISVARVVYTESVKPMLLRRVPPNLITGRGATDFASNHGFSLTENDRLVSRGARDRFSRWRREIEMAQGVDQAQEDDDIALSPAAASEFEDVREAMINGAALSSNPTIAALANESQPFSPEHSRDNGNRNSWVADVTISAQTRDETRSSSSSPLKDSILQKDAEMVTDAKKRLHESSENESDAPGFDDAWAEKPKTKRHYLRSTRTSSTGSPNTRRRKLSIFAHRTESSLSLGDAEVSDGDDDEMSLPEVEAGKGTRTRGEHAPSNHTIRGRHHGADTETVKGSAAGVNSHVADSSGQDNIVDTVGVIAVDKRGYIAAGSSSGGIGMKHRGRTGPAALVGIGTAVVPISSGDTEKATVACVTSGTGEHMATSLAAHTCAQRVYTCTKLDRRGRLVAADEDDAMKSFVDKDFMGHPAIKASHSVGAIGAMVVKKTTDGMWLYWVHNTDSFALASMHADDEEPHAAMSRNYRSGKVVTGARSMRAGGARGANGSAGADNTKSRQHYRRRRAAKHALPLPDEKEPSKTSTASRLFSSPSALLRRFGGDEPVEDGAASENAQISRKSKEEVDAGVGSGDATE